MKVGRRFKLAATPAEPITVERRRYTVYVVELEGTPCVGMVDELPCLYVGQTSLFPEQRFAQHKKGEKAGKGWVKNYGLKLRPDLYQDIAPFGGSQGWWPSVQMERRRVLAPDRPAAESLRSECSLTWWPSDASDATEG